MEKINTDYKRRTWKTYAKLFKSANRDVRFVLCEFSYQLRISQASISLKHHARPSLSWSRLVMVPTKSTRHGTSFCGRTDVPGDPSEILIAFNHAEISVFQ